MEAATEFVQRRKLEAESWPHRTRSWKRYSLFRLLLLKNGSRLNGFFACFFLGNCDFNAVSELRSLKARLEELESDLRDRDEEIQNLKSEGNQQKAVNGEESDIVKVENGFEMSQYFLREKLSIS